MNDDVKVVISGTAGVFPDCENIDALDRALNRKAHLITDDDRKWEKNDNDAPIYCGKAISHERFDATFFNVPFSFPVSMDPITRQCLETSVEAIIDAGVNPKSLDGTNTAVYANYDFTEMEVMFSEFRRDKVLAGIERCLSANRLSFCLNLHGPSCTLAGGWGTFFHLIEKAKEEIQRGYIEAAVVVCANHIMSKYAMPTWASLGMLAPDGKCRPFDQNAQGYARSDGCVAVFLQKEEDAFRNWATLMGAEDKFFKIGRKNYMAFDTENAKNVLKSIYTKCRVDPSKVGYLEADGCGVQDRDEKEIEVIREVFCKNRSSPLVLGSVKSNVGHLESASAGVSLIKAILALSKSKVPPTINIDSPLPTLTEAPELQVSTDMTPYDGELVGINVISLIGGFAHALIKKNSRLSTSKLDEKLPQLILLSSRTENGIEDVFRRLRTTKATPEFAFLLNNVFRKAMKGHMYRGFTMASPGIPNIPHKTMKVEKHDRPIWYVFSGMGSQWPGMGLQLLHVPVFRAAIERCDRVLKPRGIDIFEVLTSKDEAINDNIVHSFVAITSIQIGLTEVLRALKLEPSGVIGHSVGELGCAYADNCLTIEQTILSAYARGKAVMESTLIEGTMAAVGLGYHDIRDSVPKSIDIGCRNSSTSCTISGPAADVEAYVSKLTSEGVFAKNVSASGIAYHSRYLEPAAPLILKYLREVMPKKARRSSKWLSTSVPQEEWHKDKAIYCSPEYHLNNMMSPVLFEDVLKRIPSNAVVIEIAPHGLLQAILKREIPDRAHVPLTKRSTTGDGARFLLDAIGQMYLLGLEPDVNSLYPPIQFPVPCDTPSLQPFVTWEHSEAYPPPEALRELVASRKLKPDKVFTLGQVEDMLKQYEKKGTPVLQLSLFLTETWKLLSAINKKSVHELPVIFEDVQIFSEINFSTEGFSNIWVQILPGTGDFAVFQEFIEERPTAFGMETRVKNKNNKDTLLMQGKIVIWEEPKKTSQLEDFLKNNEFHHTLKGDEFSEGFLDGVGKINGFKTKAISDWHMCNNGVVGKVKWNPDWTVYLDTIVKINVLRDIQATGRVVKPVSIQFIHLNPAQLQNLRKGSKVDYFINSVVRHFECDGVTVDLFKTQPIREEVQSLHKIQTERLTFVPYAENSFKDQYEFVRASLQLIVENSGKVDHTNDEPLEIEIFSGNNEKEYSLLLKMFTEVLRSDDNDLKVKLTPANLPKFSESNLKANLHFVSDLKAVTALAPSNDSIISYIFVTIPAKIHMKDVLDAALKSKNHYELVYEQIFGSLRFGLLKTIIPEKELRVFQVTNNLSSTLELLKSEKILEDENVILVIPNSQCTNPGILIRRLLRDLGVSQYRFYLLMDENAPPFSLYNKFYLEQVRRDLAVNVLKNGKWGSYRSRPILRTAHADLAQLPPLVNYASTMLSNDIDIHYIGLNPASSVLRSEEKPDVLDYSGVTSLGRHVIGIAYKNKGFNKKIRLDPIFQWKIPTSVPLHEAAALPSAYLMAHFIMDKILKEPHTKTALILNGQAPIGMVCISLLLNKDWNVYVTVPNEAAKELVAAVYPQLPKANISNHSNEDFYCPVMFGTDGLGPDLIISDVPRKQMLSAWKTINHQGSFINLNEETMLHNAPLPMGSFNRDVGYFTFNLSQLERLPEERKVELHALVNEKLSSGHLVHIPHQSVDVNDLSQLSRVDVIREHGKKLILDVGKKYRARQPEKLTQEELNKFNVHGEWIANGDSARTFIVLASTINRVPNIIDWLLNRGVKKIILGTLDSRDCSDVVRRINSSTAKHEATLLMMSINPALIAAGIQKLLNQARKMGDISTIFTVSLDDHVDILESIKEATQKLEMNFINIQGETSTFKSDRMITIICEGDVDCTHVLGRAMTDPDKSATYVVSDQTQCEKDDANTDAEELMTHYLPSSLQELETLGESLCLKDLECDSKSSAEFIYTPSLAPVTSLEVEDVFPIFIIPAVCETELRPLTSRLIYPCYVAHVKPNGSSIEQIASDLLESITQIQSRGPVTLVAETWSGGLAMLISKLLADSQREVSLFLLQGVPNKLCSLIPSDQYLRDYLTKILFALIVKEDETIAKRFNGDRTFDKAMEVLPPRFNRTYIMRTFDAILKRINSLKWLTNKDVCLTSNLYLMEMNRFCKLTVEEAEKMSKKPVQLVKFDCQSYKEMLCDPSLALKIAEEAPFAW